jgi:hypothetical protein
MRARPAVVIIKTEAFDNRDKMPLLAPLLPPAFIPPSGEAGNINCGDTLAKKINNLHRNGRYWLNQAPCTELSGSATKMPLHEPAM